MCGETAELVSASDMGREKAELVWASDMGRECKLGLGGWRAIRYGMKKMLQARRSPAMWGGNADLVSASDVGRECRISVSQRCGERMQNECRKGKLEENS